MAAEITREQVMAQADGADLDYGSPGPYAGNADPALAAALDAIALSGFADETTGAVSAPTGHVARIARWLVSCDEQGFITVTEYATEDACKRDFAVLEAEYVKWSDESEES